MERVKYGMGWAAEWRKENDPTGCATTNQILSADGSGGDGGNQNAALSYTLIL